MDNPQPIPLTLFEQAQQLLSTPGVYLFYDKAGKLLYVGKAADLRKRVCSYFRSAGRLAPRIQKMVSLIDRMETRRASSEAEALLLEAQLIKEARPAYNVAFRDDKTYPMLKITHEPFPRLVVTRRRQVDGARYFGPYTNAGLMHEAVRFMRRVFPMRTCKTFPDTPCLEYHLGQCLAPCVRYIDAAAYKNIVDDLTAFLEGRRDALLRDLKRRMERAAKDRRFEEAALLRDQIQALSSVIEARRRSSVSGPLEQMQQALRLPKIPRRIEAFDISNIFGSFSVGSMVVFEDGKPKKAHYRRFRIKTVQGIDDFRMMAEVIRRRYSASLAKELPFPDLVLIDGGKGQLGAACAELDALSLRLSVVGLAKRFEHLFLPGIEQPIVLLAHSPVLHLLQRVRDEAHRFAITYHRNLRSRPITRSAFQDLPGIGPKRAARLLLAFGTLNRLAGANAQTLAQKAGVSLAQAQAILDSLEVSSGS